MRQEQLDAAADKILNTLDQNVGPSKYQEAEMTGLLSCPSVIFDLDTSEMLISDTRACLDCLACIPGRPDHFHFLEVVA